LFQNKKHCQTDSAYFFLQLAAISLITGFII